MGPGSRSSREVAAARRWRGLSASLLVLVSALAALGCGRSRGDVAVETWQMTEPISATVTFPAHLDAQTAGRPAAYVLTAVVQVPAAIAEQELTLAIPLLPSLATLRANGVVATPLEDVLSDRYRSRGPVAWRVPRGVAASGPLRLELTVENTWTQSGWIDSVPYLSARPHGATWYVFVRTWNDAAATIALGTLTPIGFTYLAMFLHGGGLRRRVHGWFAVQALAASVLPAFQLGLTQTVFGVHDAPILAISLTAAVISSVYFIHAHFELPKASLVWALAMGTVIVATAIWSGPFEATRHVGPIVIFCVQAAVIHQLYELGKLCRRRPRPENALTFLLCWVGLGVTAWDDCLCWLGIGEKLGGLHMASAGLGLFGVLQAVALSREHTSSLGRADELNVQLKARVSDLEARQKDIDALNEELRRQIAERSGQLADALARLGSEEAPATVRLQVGDVVKERYEIAREIGAGAMGTVYEVVRLGDCKRFAMKILSGLTGALDMARFAREAQLASHVNHPNVVAIADVDVASSGLIFIVMELVAGDTLLGLRARYGEQAFALEVLAQIADGLGAIHEIGIVHRDLKPANVLVSEEAGSLRVKISDFGVSTIAHGASEAPSEEIEPTTLAEPSERRQSASFDSSDTADHATTSKAPPPHARPETSPIQASPLTETGALLGTPIYMAPELAFGAKNARPSGDIFSLGVIAHEVLTGIRPWMESPAFARQRGESVPPAASLQHIARGLDPAIADVLDACLNREPSARPTAREVSLAIRAHLSHVSTHARVGA